MAPRNPQRGPTTTASSQAVQPVTEQPGDERVAPPASTEPAAPAPFVDPSGDDDEPQTIYPWPIPAEYAGRQGVDMLMEACTLYAIDPDKEAHPVQLLDWKFYAGDRRRRVPDRVILVTAGGLKLAHPADEPTIERLRRVFHCFKEKKSKDGSVEIEILDLPADLTIPSVHVDGQVPAGDQVYTRGYLKEGGASEAARRAARRNAGLP